MNRTQKFTWNEISLGTCYYPEHWDKKLWKEDMRRMKQNGIFTIRIGEFAWSMIEPSDSEFSFDFFDEFLDAAEKEQMKVIFSTPTAAPPVWLSEKYPEILNCRKDGVQYRHGMRRHYNYNSVIYQRYSKRIVEKIAEHYGKRSCIIGWQVDNEFNCEIDEFYSESDTIAFRLFLKDRYKTIDKLNEAWGTIVWSQTYRKWEEIYVPRVTIHDSTNPHQVLDYLRFVSDSCIRFCSMQTDILRKYIKREDFITTNGMFAHLDNHRLMDTCLDVYTYDSYPNLAYLMDCGLKRTNDLNDRKWSRNLTTVRSICRHFGIMEQQTGANGWNTRMVTPAPKPGQLMLWTMQSIAHGADFVSFFRWRTALFGTEIYWYGILDYDNRDNRKLNEIHKTWELVKKIQGIAGAEYKASFGVLNDYDNLWDADVDRWHQALIKSSDLEIFIASQLAHSPMDYVYFPEGFATEAEGTDNQARKTAEGLLRRFSVLFYPHALLLTESRAETLKEYVSQGGTLIIGCRTGMKQINGKCVMETMPGLLSDISGTKVTDYTFVGPGDTKVCLKWNDKLYDTGIFNDVIMPIDEATKVLANYNDDYYADEAALTEHSFGKGKVIHFGGTFRRELVWQLLKYIGIYEPYRDEIFLPQQCELAVRCHGKEKYYFVLNYDNCTSTIILHKKMTDLESSELREGAIEIEPFGVKVYRV